VAFADRVDSWRQQPSLSVRPLRRVEPVLGRQPHQALSDVACVAPSHQLALAVLSWTEAANENGQLDLRARHRAFIWSQRVSAFMAVFSSRW
jgi:hypothetical protein